MPIVCLLLPISRRDLCQTGKFFSFILTLSGCSVPQILESLWTYFHSFPKIDMDMEDFPGLSMLHSTDGSFVVEKQRQLNEHRLVMFVRSSLSTSSLCGLVMIIRDSVLSAQTTCRLGRGAAYDCDLPHSKSPVECLRGE